jgi:hypothetical protein
MKKTTLLVVLVSTIATGFCAPVQAQIDVDINLPNWGGYKHRREYPRQNEKTFTIVEDFENDGRDGNIFGRYESLYAAQVALGKKFETNTRQRQTCWWTNQEYGGYNASSFSCWKWNAYSREWVQKTWSIREDNQVTPRIPQRYRRIFGK